MASWFKVNPQVAPTCSVLRFTSLGGFGEHALESVKDCTHSAPGAVGNSGIQPRASLRWCLQRTCGGASSHQDQMFCFADPAVVLLWKSEI